MIGYGEEILKWVSSYLRDRMTRVKIETRMSKPVKTRKGVPQGRPGIPSFWREYTIDIVMSIFESKEWEVEDKKDDV